VIQRRRQAPERISGGQAAELARAEVGDQGAVLPDAVACPAHDRTGHHADPGVLGVAVGLPRGIQAAYPGPGELLQHLGGDVRAVAEQAADRAALAALVTGQRQREHPCVGAAELAQAGHAGPVPDRPVRHLLRGRRQVPRRAQALPGAQRPGV